MPSLDEIRHQIENLEHKYIFYTKREIKLLPDILIKGEHVRALVSGYMGKRTVLAVCTNRRILFLDKGLLFGMRQWQWGLDRIQSINGEYVIAFGKIRLWDGASALTLHMVWASSIDPFIKEVRQSIDDFKRLTFQEITGGRRQKQGAGQDASAQATAKPADATSQLERLAKLREDGHLSEEEFEYQKYKILYPDALR